MPVFETPTLNDFIAQLQMQTERVLRDFQRSKNDIDSMSSMSGMLQSSRHVLLVLDSVDEHVEQGVAILLGELKRALNEPELNAMELRELIAPRLEELASRIIDISQVEQTAKALQNSYLHELVSNRSGAVRQNVLFWLRQFDIGWADPVAPEVLRPSPAPR